MDSQEAWKELPAEISEKITQSSELLEFRRGDYIYRHGEEPKGIYLVAQGLVAIVLHGINGKEHLMRFFRAGQFFGHRSLFAKQAYHASTQALELTKVYFLHKKTIDPLLEAYPHFYAKIVEKLALELQHCEIQQVMLLDHQILPRVARAVVYLKEIHPSYNWTRQELANFCASTTSTVIKALAELEKMGLIKQKGRSIEIVDRASLIQMQFQGV